MLRTGYRSDRFQSGYFVVDSLGELLAQIERADLSALCEELAGTPDIDPESGKPCAEANF
jgi:phenylalanine-4-hydroxylase